MVKFVSVGCAQLATKGIAVRRIFANVGEIQFVNIGQLAVTYSLLAKVLSTMGVCFFDVTNISLVTLQAATLSTHFTSHSRWENLILIFGLAVQILQCTTTSLVLAREAIRSLISRYVLLLQHSMHSFQSVMINWCLLQFTPFCINSAPRVYDEL